MGLGSVSSWRWHRGMLELPRDLPQERKTQPGTRFDSHGWKRPLKLPAFEFFAIKDEKQRRMEEYT